MNKFFSILIGNNRGGSIPSLKPKLSEADINIVFDGDSIVAGSTAGQLQNFPVYVRDWLIARSKSVTFNSFGVPGQSTQQMLLDLNTQILPLVDNNKTNIIVALEDINAILNSGRTAQQNYDDFVNYYGQCKAAGFDYAIHITCPYPRTPNSWGETGRNRHKDYMDMCANTPMPDVNVNIDMRLNTFIGGLTQEQPINATYFNDEVHCTQLGYEVGYGEEVINKGILEIFQL